MPESTSIGGLDLSEMDLPMLPDVAIQVLELCQQEDSDAAELSAVLHRDPSLAGNVIRAANSAARGGSIQIASLQQAVSRLGVRQVADLAIAVSVRGLLFKNAGNIDRLKEIWRHSVGAGFFAREIARMRRKNVETAFLCGLLHDIGKAVLLSNLDRLLSVMGDDFVPELNRFLEDFHNKSGSYLASVWNLPDAIRYSAAHHDAPDEAPDCVEDVHTARLADLFSAHVVGGDCEVTEEDIRSCPSLDALDIYPDDLDTLFGLADRCAAEAEELS